MAGKFYKLLRGTWGERFEIEYNFYTRGFCGKHLSCKENSLNGSRFYSTLNLLELLLCRNRIKKKQQFISNKGNQ